MDEEIWLTTTDGHESMKNKAYRTLDVICVETLASDDDQTNGAKDLLRKRAAKLNGSGVVGISFTFPPGKVKATGTVIQILR